MFNYWIATILAAFLARSVQAVNIPRNLVNCYRGNETLPWSPNTLQVFLELIRKLEDANPTSMDMRRLSTQIFHLLRMDGIQHAPGIFESEYVTPYHANGIMTPKFELLLHLVSNSPGTIDFEEALTYRELCLLHRFVSASVEPFQRGDEATTCPLTLVSDQRQHPKPWITQHQIQGKNSTTSTTTISNPVSRCPLEMGTARAKDYGTLSPGVVIAALSAGLQPQTVQIKELVSAYGQSDPYSKVETMEPNDNRKTLEALFSSLDSIDNTYAATLAGDLAEVCVYQGPYLGTNVSIGTAALWNDTHFPRVRYLAENHFGRWEMTDAEILAGLDGLLLSQQVHIWINRISRLRLSQIVDMYYSGRGVPATSIENVRKHLVLAPHARPRKFPIHPSALKDREDVEEFAKTFSSTSSKIQAAFRDERVKPLSRFTAADDVSRACDRNKILEMISAKKLKDETYKMAQVLQFRTSSFWVSEAVLQRHCDVAVDRFFEYAKSLIQALPKCHEIEQNHLAASVDLIIIIDGARDVYDNLRLIAYIAEMTEVSSYSSTLSVIHGETGQYMVNRTRSVTEAFDQLRNFTGPYPTRLSLSASFGSLVQSLRNQSDEETARNLTGGNSQLVLVVAQGQRITQPDYESGQRILQGSLQRYPDLYFLFLTNDVQTFKELTSFVQQPRGPESARLQYTHVASHYSVVEANSLEPSTFENDVIDVIRHVPKRLKSSFCGRRDEYEDYLSPHQELRYRINPVFLHESPEVRVEFEGQGYGDFTVCHSRHDNFRELTCKSVVDMEAAWFNVSRPCINQPLCPPMFFSVSMDASYIKCSENDCRYPDQIRLLIRTEGLNCLENRNMASGRGTISSVLVLLLVFTFFRSW